MRRHCFTCKFFDSLLNYSDYVPAKEFDNIGFCRRSHPDSGGWPKTHSEEWCGDHVDADAAEIKEPSG